MSRTLTVSPSFAPARRSAFITPSFLQLFLEPVKAVVTVKHYVSRKLLHKAARHVVAAVVVARYGKARRVARLVLERLVFQL